MPNHRVELEKGDEFPKHLRNSFARASLSFAQFIFSAAFVGTAIGEDLKQLPHRKWAMYTWPRDAAKVADVVAVDFSADPGEIAKQSVEEFDSIRPIGPNYGIDEGSVRSLLKALRAARDIREADGDASTGGQRLTRDR